MEDEILTCIKMELGEPDASGRRRPVPVEGSDFDLEFDYILAAIGQKTDVNFIEDINAALSKWFRTETKRGEILMQTRNPANRHPICFCGRRRCYRSGNDH